MLDKRILVKDRDAFIHNLVFRCVEYREFGEPLSYIDILHYCLTSEQTTQEVNYHNLLGGIKINLGFLFYLKGEIDDFKQHDNPVPFDGYLVYPPLFLAYLVIAKISEFYTPNEGVYGFYKNNNSFKKIKKIYKIYMCWLSRKMSNKYLVIVSGDKLYSIFDDVHSVLLTEDLL